MSIDITISRTKIVVPALRPEILRRGRLLAHFDDLLEKKLVIITAPAGYGKTSLLVDFASLPGMPVCWLSLDALDKDPQRFIAYLIAALAECFPKFGRRSNAVLRSVTAFEQDSERLLASLINELDDLVNQHFTLVVDDYHFVDSVPAIRDLFSRFVSMAGENCHVILASRRLPTLPDITLLVARQQVVGFDLEELAFRPDEITTLFKQNYGVRLSSDDAQELVQQTEGWITGLHLSAGELTRRPQDPAAAALSARRDRTARASGVDLADYLDQQVLAQQPPELRQFLLRTSLLEEFDAGLCREVLGPGDWKDLVDLVRRNNLFVLPVGPQGKWLRYHHLFGEFLRERFLQESPGLAKTIFARLAQVYEQRKEWEKAYALVQQTGDPYALVGLVERVGRLVLLSEHLITLQTWLEGIPAALLDNRPALLSLKGAFLCGFSDGRTGVILLDRAVGMLRDSADLPGLALALVRRAAARRLTGDYAGAVQDADEALRLAETAPDREHIRAEAQRFRGICLFRLGQVPQAFASLEDSLQRCELLGEPDGIAHLQMDLGWVSQSTGKYAAAAGFYRQAIDKWKRENNIYPLTESLNNLSVLYYVQGDYESAVRTLEEGLTSARQGGFRTQEALLLTGLGDILSDLDEFDSARQVYTTAFGIAQQVSYPFLVNYLLLAQARLRRLRGSFKEARSHLHEAARLIQAAGSNYESGLLSFEQGCLSLAEKNLQPALSDLHSALDQFQRGALQAEADWTRAWLAAALVASGDGASARQQLSFVSAALSQNLGDPPLVHMLRHASPWLAEVLPDPLSKRVALAGHRLPALRKRLRRMLKAAPLQASRLTIQALGKPQVHINGKLVVMSQWQTLSVRDLFFFFMTASHPVTKEEIADILWPELDTARLKLRFKNELYRLRHALGRDAILFENNQYFFNRHLDYEFDVEEFDAHLAQVRTLEKTEDKLVHLRLATRLWRGPYLQDLGAIWAWPERQRLEQACLEAFRQLVELHQQGGNPEAALQECQRALEVDPCREEFHRLAMHLHAGRGDRMAVIWQYQACREALLTGLDVSPSEETETLYRRLIA
jgi:LuxR family transcriptional regulator, maltose regulon positive regulatory protein